MKLDRILLGILLFTVFLLLPLPIPTAARYVAAVTVLMVAWWVTEAIPLEATALLPLLLFPLLGVLSAAEAAAPYADRVIFLFLGGFIIAMSMQRWGLHRRIALHIISLLGTGPKKLVLGFMVSTAFLSMWISNTATAMMMIPIAIAIITTILPNGNPAGEGLTEEQQSFAACLVIAVAYAASIGGIATIIGSPPNGIFVAQLHTLFPAAPPIDFFSWMLFGVPFVAAFIPVTWLWLVYGPYRHLPQTVSHAGEIISQELRKMGPMGRGERWTLLVFVLTALAWIFEKSKDIGGVTIPGLDVLFPAIDDSTVAIFGALLLFLLPVDREKGIYTMDWKTAVQIPWGILLLFGGGLALSTGFIQSGLAQQIVSSLTVLGVLPVLAVVLIIAIAVSLFTEVTSNTAIASIMMPIMAVTSVSLLVNPYLLMLTAAVCASIAFMFPVATPPNAIAYGTGHISMQQMLRTGWPLNFIGIGLWVAVLFTVTMWALGFTVELPAWAVPP
ncbi:MAG: DASS family sodium-coupled anion symporter [Methanomicrobiales archaeon]|nr:DASS family sodium-coupled anion symporter [Methanomicrobiales archaeon]MDI6875997.1 DASS family sodium-coupled anion symporter [Methanomicrobiales archaeon]